MMRGIGKVVVTAVFGFLATTSISEAATYTIIQDISDFSTNPTLTNSPLVSYTGTASIVTGSSSGQYRSPFENAATPGSGVGNWATLPYISIQGDASATFSFFPSNTLTLLWGSPDSYNSLSFYSTPDGTGAPIATYTGSDLSSLVAGVGHDFVTFTGPTFLSVVLTSNLSNAFEFAGLSAYNTGAGTTPLPAALPLFGVGAAILGITGWRRKRKAKAPA
jgi:hypothetical protein